MGHLGKHSLCFRFWPLQVLINQQLSQLNLSFGANLMNFPFLRIEVINASLWPQLINASSVFMGTIDKRLHMVLIDKCLLMATMDYCLLMAVIDKCLLMASIDERLLMALN